MSASFALSTGGEMLSREYQELFEARIVKRLLNEHGTKWTHDQATTAARIEWDAFIVFNAQPFALPEDAADECVMEWGTL